MRRVLVASDGSPESLGALAVARALHERAGEEGSQLDVEVLAAVEPLPIFDTGFMVALPEGELLTRRTEEMRVALEAALADLGPGAAGWRVSVEQGTAAPTVAGRAASWGADLLVAGLGQHRALDRIFGTETVLQLLHVVHAPVLAVPGTAPGLPDTAVVAVDFSEFGVRAARAGADLLGPAARYHLVHVLSGSEGIPASSGDWRTRFVEEAEARLRALAREMGVADGRADVHVREGDPAAEVLEVAREVGADLVVAGTHGHSFMGRLLAGSVSTRLVRGVTTSILVVPPPEDTGPGPHPQEEGPSPP